MRSLAPLVLWPALLAAQPKPLVPPKDYGKFENLGAGRLAPDGRWLAYSVTRVDETSELRIRPVARDSVRSYRWGSGPVFDPAGRWVAWTVGASPEEKKKLEADKKPLRLGLGLLGLASGAERTMPGVQSFAFDASGRFLAALGYPPDEPKGKGADLRVLDLAAGTELLIGNVGECAWSKAGSLLAVTVATGTDLGNGVQLYDAAAGTLRSLDGSSSAYRQLAWRKEGPDLAVLKSVDPAGKKTPGHQVLAWRGLGGGTAPGRRGPPAGTFRLEAGTLGIPDSVLIAEFRPPQWSPDGRRIAVGLRPKEAKPDSAKLELPEMQIWHASDVTIVPAQRVRAQANARRTLLAVWEPDGGRVVPVGTDLAEDASLTEDWATGIESVRAPYGWGTMFGRPYHDVYATDLATGARTKVLEKVRYHWVSSGGKYLVWFDGKDYWSLRLDTKARVNLTAGVAAAFADTAFDTPTDQLPPHGVGGWLDGDRGVFLYDRDDVWRAGLDGGTPVRLTSGAGDSTVHRLVPPTGNRKSFDPAAPLYLTLHGEWSEKRGYARLEPGKPVERLLWADQLVSGLARADSAPVYLYRAEARDDSPDLFVAGPRLDRAVQVTATNPFLRDYAWTRMRLVDFANERGRKLQGVLLYPANFDPSRRYPMIVYCYEILSDQAHVFRTPNEREYYNPTAWTQAGYFVFMPDIVFRARDPGVSVLETLRPAVAAVAALGEIDPKRVGLVGHSWGGYIGAYVPTRTDLFAASIAGAPLTDFVSMMGQIHWNQGNPEVDHWETGQARMEVPYWEDPAAHERNSPIHKVQEMKTPLLLAHGDKDGTVEFFQSTEFYNYARRAGKQVVLLVYEGENHGFTKKPNQIDYQRRILEWFGYYLKGDPPAPWIRQGIPVERQEAERRRVAGANPQ